MEPLSPLRSVLPTACRQQQNAERHSGRLYYGAEIGFVKLFLFVCSVIEVANISFFLPLNNLFFKKEEVSFLAFYERKAKETNLFHKAQCSNSKNLLFGKLSPWPVERSPPNRSDTFYVRFSALPSTRSRSWRTFFCQFVFPFFFSFQRGLLERGLRDSPQRALGILTMMRLQLLFMHLPCRPFTPGGGTSLHGYK